MAQLSKEFAPLPKEQIDKRDPYNSNNSFVGFRARSLQNRSKTGVRYEGETEGGEVKLFE